MEAKRRTKKSRTSLATTAVAVSSILIVSGCVIAPEDEAQERPENESEPNENQGGEDSDSEPLDSSATTSTTLGMNLQVDILSLERIENETLKLNIQVANNSDEHYPFQDALGDMDNMHAPSQVTLIDPESQTRHVSHEQSDGSCYCSAAEGGIPGGDSVNLWIMFPAPPEDIESMAVATPITAPFFDIPITDSSETYDTQGISTGDIVPLTMISDDLGDNTGRTESDEEVSILLSSDVLFDTGSSDLTDDAEEIIEQVASEIDQSSSPTVKVDGHADDRGSDDVNTPLSEDRAEAVENLLSDKITRENVNFSTEGHGSSDPIADNDTPEGQERNRRVTVTFEK